VEDSTPEKCSPHDAHTEVNSLFIYTVFHGIFNDQFPTHSLLSPRVKNFENQSTFVEVMGN